MPFIGNYDLSDQDQVKIIINELKVEKPNDIGRNNLLDGVEDYLDMYAMEFKQLTDEIHTLNGEIEGLQAEIDSLND